MSKARITARSASISTFSAVLALASGCGVVAKRVNLNYLPSKNVVARPHQTALQMDAFVDRRANKASFGKAPADMPGVKLPIRPTTDPAAWMTEAARSELQVAGYEITPNAVTHVGGAVKDVDCGTGAKAVCTVRVEAWIVGPGNWKLLDQEYSGEGILPSMFGEDPYEQSLRDALREAMEGFRRDASRVVP